MPSSPSRTRFDEASVDAACDLLHHQADGCLYAVSSLAGDQTSARATGGGAWALGLWSSGEDFTVVGFCRDAWEQELVALNGRDITL